MVDNLISTQLTRRGLLKRSAVSAFAVGGGAALLSACGDDSKARGGTGSASEPSSAPKASAVTGTAVYLNYPGWIGPQTVKHFESKFPGAKIEQTATGMESLSGVALTVAQNPTAYDMLLASTDIAEQLAAGDLTMPISEENVPALKYVNPRVRELYPYGLPLETGYSGFAYRRDLIDEDLTSWEDFWRIAPSQSRKITAVGIDRPIIGAALNYLGFDSNTTTQSELDAALKALEELKPHVLSFKTTGTGQSLKDGSAVMALGYNFDIVPVVQEDPRLVWVTPSEGTTGYIEGIVGVSQTDNADTVRAFMDFCLQPAEYADFINEVNTPRVTTNADDLIDKNLLDPIYDLPDDAQMLKFLGPDATKAYNRLWSEFQAS